MKKKLKELKKLWKAKTKKQKVQIGASVGAALFLAILGMVLVVQNGGMLKATLLPGEKLFLQFYCEEGCNNLGPIGNPIDVTGENKFSNWGLLRLKKMTPFNDDKKITWKVYSSILGKDAEAKSGCSGSFMLKKVPCNYTCGGPNQHCAYGATCTKVNDEQSACRCPQGTGYAPKQDSSWDDVPPELKTKLMVQIEEYMRQGYDEEGAKLRAINELQEEIDYYNSLSVEAQKAYAYEVEREAAIKVALALGAEITGFENAEPGSDEEKANVRAALEVQRRAEEFRAMGKTPQEALNLAKQEVKDRPELVSRLVTGNVAPTYDDIVGAADRKNMALGAEVTGLENNEENRDAILAAASEVYERAMQIMANTGIGQNEAIDQAKGEVVARRKEIDAAVKDALDLGARITGREGDSESEEGKANIRVALEVQRRADEFETMGHNREEAMKMAEQEVKDRPELVSRLVTGNVAPTYDDITGAVDRRNQELGAEVTGLENNEENRDAILAAASEVYERAMQIMANTGIGQNEAIDQAKGEYDPNNNELSLGASDFDFSYGSPLDNINEVYDPGWDPAAGGDYNDPDSSLGSYDYVSFDPETTLSLGGFSRPEADLSLGADEATEGFSFESSSFDLSFDDNDVTFGGSEQVSFNDGSGVGGGGLRSTRDSSGSWTGDPGGSSHPGVSATSTQSVNFFSPLFNYFKSILGQDAGAQTFVVNPPYITWEDCSAGKDAKCSIDITPTSFTFDADKPTVQTPVGIISKGNICSGQIGWNWPEACGENGINFHVTSPTDDYANAFIKSNQAKEGSCSVEVFDKANPQFKNSFSIKVNPAPVATPAADVSVQRSAAPVPAPTPTPAPSDGGNCAISVSPDNFSFTGGQAVRETPVNISAQGSGCSGQIGWDWADGSHTCQRQLNFYVTSPTDNYANASIASYNAQQGNCAVKVFDKVNPQFSANFFINVAPAPVPTASVQRSDPAPSSASYTTTRDYTWCLNDIPQGAFNVHGRTDNPSIDSNSTRATLKSGATCHTSANITINTGATSWWNTHTCPDEGPGSWSGVTWVFEEVDGC